MPTVRINVINHSKMKYWGNVNLDDLLSTLESYSITLSEYWQTPSAIMTIDSKLQKRYNFVFLDDADQADALGYHEMYKGFPLSKIFVKTTVDDGEDFCVTASHELAEMLVDPSADQTVSHGKMLYAREVCDAVEESSFDIAGLRMSNFVLPAWFSNVPNQVGPFDYLKKVKKPFQLLKGGYAAVYKNNKWTQIFGSIAKMNRWKKEDRRGHRNESLRKNIWSLQ